MLTGSDPSALVATFLPYDEVDVLGVNCAFGPTELTRDGPRTSPRTGRGSSARCPTRACRSWSTGKAHFPMGPADFTKGMMRFVDEFGVNIVGGCCGTMPEHLKMLVRGASPRRNAASRKAATRRVVGQAAGLEPYTAEDIRQDHSYLIVAERTNTNGSRQFKRLLQEENWDGLVSMARDEVRDGSHMLDVCVDFVGRDGVRDMHEVVRRYVNSVNPCRSCSTAPTPP